MQADLPRHHVVLKWYLYTYNVNDLGEQGTNHQPAGMRIAASSRVAVGDSHSGLHLHVTLS